MAFKMPAREVLIASAHRLLRFEFPVTRNIKAYERLIKTHLISTGLSKKKLEQLPLPLLEAFHHQIWENALGPARWEDEWLNLLLLVEETMEFDAEQLMNEDIHLLGLREPGKIPHFYYEKGLHREQLAQFLSLQGIRHDFLQTESTSPAFQYLACRRLQHPLPWSRLLDDLTPAECDRFKRLKRLRDSHKLLQQQPWYTKGLHEKNLPQALGQVAQQLQDFLSAPPLRQLASQCQVATPVQTLVLVEGETERLLLPGFAQAMGHDFYALGIELWPAGGKNQMPGLYRELSQQLLANIIIVLDRDADAIAQELQAILRPQDAIFQIEEGEFEDIYDLSWITSIINTVYQPYPELSPDRFKQFGEENGLTGHVQILKGIWQAHGLGAFDKVTFAQHYAERFADMPEANLPPSMEKLLQAILAVHQARKA